MYHFKHMYHKGDYMKKLIRIVFSLFFGLMGVMHLVKPTSFETMLPDETPMKKPVILGTGIIELIFSLLIFKKPTESLKKIINLYLLAVLPAHIYMAATDNPKIEASKSSLYRRIPLQFVMMFFVKKI